MLHTPDISKPPKTKKRGSFSSSSYSSQRLLGVKSKFPGCLALWRGTCCLRVPSVSTSVVSPPFLLRCTKRYRREGGGGGGGGEGGEGGGGGRKGG